MSIISAQLINLGLMQLGLPGVHFVQHHPLLQLARVVHSLENSVRYKDKSNEDRKNDV